MSEVGVTSKEITRRSGRRWLIEYPRVIPAAIFAAITAMVAIAVVAIERGETDSENAGMRTLAQAAASGLERRANANSTYLRAGATLLEAEDVVTPESFLRVVTEMELDTSIQGTDGVGWAEALRPGQVDAFERRLSEYGFSAAGIFFDDQRQPNRIVPVTFLLPASARNRRALGYDMYSEPVRRAAMNEAEEIGSPTATGRIELVQEGGTGAAGFLIYMPVFDGRGMNRSLRGFIYSPINANQFLDLSIGVEPPEKLGLALYDGDAAPERLMARVGPAESAGKRLVEEVEIANRSYLLVVESSDRPILSFVSMLTLLFGVSVASLLMLVARLMTAAAEEDKAALDWLEQQHSIRNTLTRELNHRVKNTLANVLSIAAMTRRRSNNLDDYADRLEGRIRALSATHDLLTQSEWGATPIREVVEAELRPYEGDNEELITVDGPEIEIAPNDALSLGLALHELATNAVKYGSLSQPSGRVNLTWRLKDSDLVEMLWEETGGPVVPHNRSRGFGTDLIEKIVAHELKQPVALEFNETGVRCKLMVPVRNLQPFEMRARHEGTGK